MPPITWSGRGATRAAMAVVALIALSVGLMMAGTHREGSDSRAVEQARAAAVLDRAGRGDPPAPARTANRAAVKPLSTERESGPDTVIAGVYIANIQRVDLPSNSFDADLYVWLRWTNPDIDPSESVEIMNVYQSWGLVETPVYDEPQKQPDGSLLWLARYQGSFNAPLTLSDYPFEEQTLRLVIEDGQDNVRSIVYEPDTDPVGIDREITLPGYNFGEPRVSFGSVTYDSSFGEIDPAPDAQTYTRMTVEIPLSAPAVSGVVKTVLPIVIVMIAAALALVVPATYVDSKLNLCITALLALVAGHWGATSGLPQTNYLLMIDLLYIIAFAATTAMIAASVVGAWVLKEKGEQEAMALEQRALWVISAAFLLSMSAVLLVYLPEGPVR